MEKRFCSECDREIPQARLEILPDTETCVRCSKVKKKTVFPVFSHKTAPEMVVIDSDDTESVRLAERAHHRER